MSAPELRRVLGPVPAAAVVAGSMVGIGIFLTPPLVAAATSSLTGFFVLWLLGGLSALCGATAYAELGAMMPRAGGDYEFHRRAYGPALAFASGAVTYSVSFAASVAALTAAFSKWYLPDFLAAAGVAADLEAPWLGPVTGGQLVAVAGTLVLTGLNAAGARLSGAVQTAVTVTPFALLVALGAWGLASGHGLVGPAAARPLDLSALSGAWLAIVFTYAGWPNVVYVAGEVENPQRTLPLGMFAGAGAVTALYLLLCAAFVAVLGFEGLAGAGEAGSAMAAALLGPSAGLGIKVLLCVALLAATNGCVLAGARVGYAMAARGALPEPIARVNPHTGAPASALWLQAAIAIAFLLTGTFDAILETASLAISLIGCLSVAAVVLLRRSMPETERPYRATGYPVTIGLFLALNGAAMLIALREKLRAGEAGPALAGLVVMVLLALAWRLRGRPTVEPPAER